MTSNLTIARPATGARHARIKRLARLAGRVDSHVVPDLASTIDEAMRVADDIALDLADVRFLDVPAMMAIEEGRGRIEARGGQLVVAAASSAVTVILEMAATAGILDAPAVALGVAA